MHGPHCAAVLATSTSSSSHNLESAPHMVVLRMSLFRGCLTGPVSLPPLKRLMSIPLNNKAGNNGLVHPPEPYIYMPSVSQHVPSVLVAFPTTNIQRTRGRHSKNPSSA